MANIYKNLVDRLKLGRRIANSQAGNDPNFESMMDEIYGSRTEEFATNMLEDAAGTTRAVAIGDSAIEVGGLGISGWIAIIVALLFLIGLLLQSLMPLFTNIPPPAVPHVADAIRQAPSEETLRELPTVIQEQQNPPPGSARQPTPSQKLDKEIIERGGAFPGMLPDSRPSLRPGPTAKPGSSLDEGALQRERLNAITSGDTARYNQLIEEHIALYKKHRVNPCTSGFFPQGCR